MRCAAIANRVGHGWYATSNTTGATLAKCSAHGSTAPPGRVEMHRSNPPICSTCEKSATDVFNPSSAARSRSRSALAISRTTTVTSLTFNPRNAASVDAAVALPPSTTAVSAPVMPCSAKAFTSPGTSVLCADRDPSGSNSIVFAAPISSATGSTVSTRSSATRFSGIVSDSPRTSSPSEATNPRSSSSPTSKASYRQSRPSAAYAARCIAGDNECAIGDPSTAQRVISSAPALVGGAPRLQLGDVGVVLRLGARERRLTRVQVDQGEVQPRALRRVDRRPQRVHGRRRDRRRRQTHDLVGVVRRDDLTLLRRREHAAVPGEHVVHRRVHLQLHPGP